MLTLCCTLLRGVFEGARSDEPRSAEWPPSWMRLFSALVAVSEGRDDDRLLIRLEAERPPEITCSQALRPRLREAFVPTNALAPAGGSTTWAARTNGQRSWARAIPRDPKIWYAWPDLELSAEESATVVALSRRVAYLGRATSSASVEAVDAVSAPADAQRLVPSSRVAAGERLVALDAIRCAEPGALAELREVYQDKHVRQAPADPWRTGRAELYGTSVPVDPSPEHRRPALLVVFALVGRYLDGRHGPAVAYALRRRLQASAAAPAGAVITALPDVGHQHADGHLLGLAITLPDVQIGPLQRLAEGLRTEDGELAIPAGALGVLRLRRVLPLESTSTTRGLQEARWRGPSPIWVSALPFVAAPGGEDAEVAAVLASIRGQGLPAPEELTLSRRPLQPGAVDLLPRDVRATHVPLRHARLVFPSAVPGPLTLGPAGLGLLAPARTAGG